MTRLRSGFPAVWVVMLGLGLLAFAWSGPARAAEAGSGGAALAAGGGGAVSAPAPDCERLVQLFDRQREQMASDLGRVKREMAALREDLAKPGMRDIVAGIGYIFGIAGIVLFFQSRRPRKGSGTDEGRKG